MKTPNLLDLLGKLIFAVLAFPPLYIVVKYLRWCGKQEKDCGAENQAS